jgi:threonine/homoserine/homoserine lactone efflux protein
MNIKTLAVFLVLFFLLAVGAALLVTRADEIFWAAVALFILAVLEILYFGVRLWQEAEKRRQVAEVAAQRRRFHRRVGSRLGARGTSGYVVSDEPKGDVEED